MNHRIETNEQYSCIITANTIIGYIITLASYTPVKSISAITVPQMAGIRGYVIKLSPMSGN